jgi:hypothetical protein
MNWETVKENLRLWYARTAQFVLFQNLVLYIIASVTAGRLLGPASYAAFLYRLFTFR